jgi:malate dehydrogenase
MFKIPKVSIIGAGNVGEHIALLTAKKNLANIILIDILQDLPKGKALDLNQSSIYENFSFKIIGSSDYELIKDSDIIVITAGMARKPGMSREDLLKYNAEIVYNISQNIKKISPNSIIIVVTNPVDVMTYIVLKILKADRFKVIGESGALDSARFAYFISEKLNLSIENIQPMVLGGHGDTMLPLPRYTTISGIPLNQFLSENEIKEIVQRTIDGGAEIVKLLKNSSAYYAPASSTVKMIESILLDKKLILPCSLKIENEYENINDVCIGVPVILGKNGVEKIIKLNLTEEENRVLQKSAEEYKKQIEIAIKLLNL